MSKKLFLLVFITSSLSADFFHQLVTKYESSNSLWKKRILSTIIKQRIKSRLNSLKSDFLFIHNSISSDCFGILDSICKYIQKHNIKLKLSGSEINSLCFKNQSLTDLQSKKIFKALAFDLEKNELNELIQLFITHYKQHQPFFDILIDNNQVSDFDVKTLDMMMGQSCGQLISFIQEGRISDIYLPALFRKAVNRYTKSESMDDRCNLFEVISTILDISNIRVVLNQEWDTFGNTPLNSINYKYPRLALLFIENGAEPFLINNCGKSVFDKRIGSYCKVRLTNKIEKEKRKLRFFKYQIADQRIEYLVPEEDSINKEIRVPRSSNEICLLNTLTLNQIETELNLLKRIKRKNRVKKPDLIETDWYDQKEKEVIIKQPVPGLFYGYYLYESLDDMYY